MGKDKPAAPIPPSPSLMIGHLPSWPPAGTGERMSYHKGVFHLHFMPLNQTGPGWCRTFTRRKISSLTFPCSQLFYRRLWEFLSHQQTLFAHPETTMPTPHHSWSREGEKEGFYYQARSSLANGVQTCVEKQREGYIGGCWKPVPN